MTCELPKMDDNSSSNITTLRRVLNNIILIKYKRSVLTTTKSQ